MSFNIPSNIILNKDFQRARHGIQEAVNRSKGPESLVGPAQSMAEANADIVSSDGLHGLLKIIEKEANKIPVFDVILPTEPHDVLLRDISNWFRGQIHQTALIKLSIRRSIGGGIVVRSKNRIFDMSFRPKIMAAKDKIPEVMRRV